MYKIQESHWSYREKDLPEGCIGFVYQITKNLNSRIYVGKKILLFKKSKKLKGKRKIISYVESDWKIYTGSSKELNLDIITSGKDNFTFQILECYNNKWALAYAEAKLIIENDLLLKEESYNNGIMLRLKGKK